MGLGDGAQIVAPESVVSLVQAEIERLQLQYKKEWTKDLDEGRREHIVNGVLFLFTVKNWQIYDLYIVNLTKMWFYRM